MRILRRLKLFLDAFSGEQQRIPLPLGCNLYWREDFSRLCRSLRRRLLFFNRFAFPTSRHECGLYSVGDYTYGRSCLGFQLHRSTRIAIIILCLEANLVYCSRIGLRFAWIGFAEGAVVMRLGDANFVTVNPILEAKPAPRSDRECGKACIRGNRNCDASE
jgi:hypothetical protein